MGEATVLPRRADARTLGALCDAVAQVLAHRSGGDAPRDARELLAAVHDMPRHWPSIERGSAVSPDDWGRAMRAAERFANGAPLQYAAGQASFRHLTLDVDERVLIPRPETEQLVELVLDLVGTERGGIAVDVGTGSGAIALALASEGPFGQVIATDVSRDALVVARRNVTRCAPALRVPLSLRDGSVLRPVPERPLRAVVSNPPYISFDEAAALPSGVRDWEPAIALFAASNGMAVIAGLIQEAATALGDEGLLAMEVDTRRASLVAELVASHGAYGEVRVLLDLTGRERFVVARRRGEAR